MRSVASILALLLCTALFIQNTCPRGSAGRSSIAASRGHSTTRSCCRMAAPVAEAHDAADSLRRQAAADPFPPFVFDDASAARVLVPGTIASPRSRPTAIPGYLLPVEILKPPAV